MPMSPARQELYNAIVSSVDDAGCAENLKHIVETRCLLPLNKAYAYVRNFKDLEISHSSKKHGRPLIIKVNKEMCE